jgi:hypothetical protein
MSETLACERKSRLFPRFAKSDDGTSCQGRRASRGNGRKGAG